MKMTKEDRKKWCSDLLARLHKLGIPRYKVAEAAFINRMSIQKWERGGGTPSTSSLYALSKAIEGFEVKKDYDSRVAARNEARKLKRDSGAVSAT